MKRVLGILLALTLVVGWTIAPSFGSPQPRQEEKKEKGEKKKKGEKGEKGEKKKGEGKKKGEKKEDK